MFIRRISPILLALYTMQANALCWNGIYGGIEAGESSSRFNYTYDNANYFNTIGPAVLGSDFNLSASGITGGGYLGYLYQVGPSLLFGLEGNLLASSQDANIDSPFFPTFDIYKTSLHTLVNAKLKIAYSYREWLWSISGGYAGGKIRLSLYDTNAPFSASATDWLNGWSIGLGFDYRLRQHVSLGLAYDYSQLNMYNKTLSCNNCSNRVGFDTPVVYGGVTVQTLLARLTYYFN
jgi:outer membrane immunogenic protein